MNKMKSNGKPVTKVSSKPEMPKTNSKPEMPKVNSKQEMPKTVVEAKVQPSAPPMPVDFQLAPQANATPVPTPKKNLLAAKQFHLTNDDIILRQPLSPKLNPKL